MKFTLKEKKLNASRVRTPIRKVKLLIFKFIYESIYCQINRAS